MDAILLGEEIRRRRHTAKLTQAELGYACSLSRESIANIEKARHRIHADTLCFIADALGISPSTLLRVARESNNG